MIPVVCFTHSTKDILKDINNVSVVPKDNYEVLIERLKAIIQKGADWYRIVEDVKEYIINNIRTIYPVNQISEKFHVRHRRLSDEFVYITGKSIQEFITDTKFNMVTEALKKKKKTGRYIIIAKENGIKSAGNLLSIIKRKTGKTIIQYHKEILESSDKNIKI